MVLPPYVHHRDVNVQTARRKLPSLIGQRPWLSSLVEPTAASVHVVDGALNVSSLGAMAAHFALPRHLRKAPLSLIPHELPRCGRARAPQPAHEAQACVHWIEPPEAHQSVGAALQRLRRLAHAPWLHYSSMLDVLGARRQHRYPLATWEQQLQPSSCRLRYRRDAIDAAREALRPALPGFDSGRFAAAHVRALSRDRYKAEASHEYLPRLRRLVTRAREALRVASLPLFIATDDPETVLPRAAAALAQLNATVVSQRGCTAAALREVHPDAEAAAILLDVAALLAASAFSPAPRSGLSVHLAALRGCERDGQPCDAARAASCVRYAGAGCGGVFSEALLLLERQQSAVGARTTRVACRHLQDRPTDGVHV